MSLFVVFLLDPFLNLLQKRMIWERVTGKKRMILESSGKSGSTTKSSDITGRNSGKSGSTVRENYFEDYFHLEDYLLLLGGDHGR
jgi:hypothetical protein